MKAARWIGLGRVECEDVPVPLVADGEVLVRTVYASICGSDLHEVFFETPPPSMRRPGTPGTRASARWWSRAVLASLRGTAC